MTQEITISVTGVADGKPLQDIWLYPNPNSGIFTVVTGQSMESYDLEIFDVVGNSVFETVLAPSSSGSLQIEIPDVVPGVYSVVIMKNDQRRVIRIAVF
jgi:hypothetical protein